MLNFAFDHKVRMQWERGERNEIKIDMLRVDRRRRRLI